VDGTTLLAPLAQAPQRTAIILDVDGTLAPIVARPELARVPDDTRSTLRRLAGRYLLVACVSGRPGQDAARLVGVDGVRFVGNHGLELLPDADAVASQIQAFKTHIAGRMDVEDKGLSLSLHYREAPDEQQALRGLQTIAREAEEAGLDARFGRKVLEIRPSVAADKGTAVRSLLTEAQARNALYAGDDTTDLDAFRGLREAGLEHAIAIAISSAESAPELLEEADLVVDGPAGLVSILEGL
jgi:trehalose 6-phosphate phosphatase